MSLPNEYTAMAPGALGATLSQCGYRARIVVERTDGASLTQDDREIIANTMAAMEDRDRAAEREFALLGFVGGRHFALLPPIEHIADAAE